MPADLSSKEGGDTKLPAWPTSVLDSITPTWRRGGVPDVFAWNARKREVLFAEAKRKGHDRLRPDQIAFIKAGIAAGYPPESFVIVEWDYAPV